MAEFILIIPVLLLSLSIHEYAHGLAADFLGDPTARLMGRLTINPLSHLDPIGALFLLVTRRFGWAKPVPVNPANLREPKRDIMFVSLAGPLANVILSFLFSLVFRLFIVLVSRSIIPYSYGNIGYFLHQMISAGIYLNLTLAFFNLIPIPPLDGSKILRGLVPRTWNGYFAFLEGPYGMLVLIVLMYSGLLGKLILPVVNVVANVFLLKI